MGVCIAQGLCCEGIQPWRLQPGSPVATQVGTVVIADDPQDVHPLEIRGGMGGTAKQTHRQRRGTEE